MEQDKNSLSTMDFDSLSISEGEACNAIYEMLVDVGARDELKVSEDALRKFVNQIPHFYNSIPFHCFQHAVMVSQMAYLIITRCGLRDIIGRRRSVSLLIAALCHDMQHPGLSNEYLKRTGHEFAQTYKLSPLENHHAACAHTLLTSGIMSAVDDDVQQQILADTREFILATDLSNHGAIMKAVKEVTPGFSSCDEEQLLVLCKVVLKCADVSNECRPQAIADRWLDKLNTEFWAQGDQEKSEGVTPIAMMDRDMADIDLQQIGFLNNLVLPMFTALYTLLPGFKELTSATLQGSLEHYRRSVKPPV